MQGWHWQDLTWLWHCHQIIFSRYWRVIQFFSRELPTQAWFWENPGTFSNGLWGLWASCRNTSAPSSFPWKVSAFAKLSCWKQPTCPFYYDCKTEAPLFELPHKQYFNFVCYSSTWDSSLFLHCLKSFNSFHNSFCVLEVSWAVPEHCSWHIHTAQCRPALRCRSKLLANIWESDMLYQQYIFYTALLCNFLSQIFYKVFRGKRDWQMTCSLDIKRYIWCHWLNTQEHLHAKMHTKWTLRLQIQMCMLTHASNLFSRHLYSEVEDWD